LTGTLLNIVTVLIGGTLGLFFGASLPDRLRQTVINGLGLFTAAYGLMIFLKTQNPLIVLGALLVGSLLGEWWQIEDRLRGLGAFLEKNVAQRFSRSTLQAGVSSGDLDETRSNRFIRGFLTSSLLFCVGPMAILGSIQDGLTGDYSTLAIKSVLDGFASFAFASTLGLGVLFSSLVILAYQGGLSLTAAQAAAVITPRMMEEMTATGGVLMLAIAISSLLEIKPIRVGNFLPALLVAPLIVAVLAALGLE
jgi:uncharacterized protein